MADALKAFEEELQSKIETDRTWNHDFEPRRPSADRSAMRSRDYEPADQQT